MSDCKGIFQRGQELAQQYNELMRSLDTTPGDGQVVLKDVTDSTINTAMLAHAAEQMRVIRQGLKAGQDATMGSCSDRFGFALSFFGSAGFSSAVSQLELALAHVRDKNAGVDAFPGFPLIGCSTQDPTQDIADYDDAGTNDQDDLIGDFDSNNVSDSGGDDDTDIRPDTDTIADKDQVPDVDGAIDPDDDEPMDLDLLADEDAVISSDDDATDADPDVDSDVIIVPDDDTMLDADQMTDGDGVPPDGDSVSDDDGLVNVDDDAVVDADSVDSDDDIIEIPDVDSDDPPLACRDGIELLTRGFDGSPADNNSNAPAVSRDGRYVAFQSTASNLVSDDTNGKEDIFVLDRAMQATICISRPTGGGESNGSSYAPSMSADGKFVAFQSDATNLTTPESLPGGVYVYDADNNVIEKIASSGAGAKISPDGRYVTFSSSAVLVPGDTNGVNDVFIYDRTSGSMRVVSISNDPSIGNSDSVCPSFNDDASKVMFTSSASNFYTRDTNNSTDVYMRDVTAGATSPMSINYGKQVGNSGSSLDCHNNLTTANGRYVAFLSSATNLLGSEISAAGGLMYVRDLWAGSAGNELASLGLDGQLPDAAIMQPELSDDGRFAVYASYAANIDSNDANPAKDVFVYDRWNKKTELVSVQPDGSRSWGSSGQPSLSGDNKVLVVKSNGLLTQGAPSSVYNLYAISMGCFFDVDQNKPPVIGPVEDQVAWVNRKLEFTVPVSDPEGLNVSNVWIENAPANFVYDSVKKKYNWVPSWDQVGDHIVNICAADKAGYASCLPVLVTVKPIELISRKPDGSLPTTYPTSLHSYNPSIDAEGTTIAYSSREAGIVDGYNPCAGHYEQVYKHDLSSGTNECISAGMFGTAPNGTSATFPAISPDGQHIAYHSVSTNLLPTPVEGGGIYVYDVLEGLNDQVYVGDKGYISVGANGRYVAHHVPLLPFAGWTDVIRYDRDTDMSEIVSEGIPYTIQVNGTWYKPPSSLAAMSADGRYVLFSARDGGNSSNIFLRDTLNHSTEWINVNDDYQVAVGTMGAKGLSDDGRYVLLCSDASNLVDDDTNGVTDCFIRDRETQRTKRITVTPEGGEFDAGPISAVMSKDGNFILFGYQAPTETYYKSIYYLYSQESESSVVLDDDMVLTSCSDMNYDGTRAVCVANASTNPSSPLNVIVMLGIDKYLSK